MGRSHPKVRIFAEIQLRDYLQQKISSVLQSIEDERDEYLLNVNDVDYVKYKIEQAYVKPLIINEDQITVSSSEQIIAPERLPNSHYIYRGRSQKKVVIKFHVPFSGDQTLLKCKPAFYSTWTINIELLNREFCFEIINFNDYAPEINLEKDSILRHIAQQLESVVSEVERYNSGLDLQISKVFNARKKRILTNKGILASLGVPIRKASNVSPTFSIPAPQHRKKVSVNKPVVEESGFEPEPTLDKDTYDKILSLIHDVGKEFERLPSLYKDKEEEHLRDHFLMMLEPNFEGSATGETFNKKGKTDILLRYEGTNVFIAECKFWHGKKGFLDTVSQLLGYLTWRDSKAAVIMFVQNKDFSTVIETVKSIVKEHSNYLEYKGVRDESWFNYVFHINDDRNRQVKLAVMLYHIPK